MNAPIFTPEELADFEAHAHQRGFAGVRDYIRSLVNQDAQAYSEDESDYPTIDELMAMTLDERDYWLEKAAALAEDLYRNDPELTITADAIDLYDYPDE